MEQLGPGQYRVPGAVFVYVDHRKVAEGDVARSTYFHVPTVLAVALWRRGPAGVQVYVPLNVATAFAGTGYNDRYLPMIEQKPGETWTDTIRRLAQTYLGFSASQLADRYMQLMVQSLQFAVGARTGGNPCHVTNIVFSYEVSADEAALLQLNHGSDGRPAMVRVDGVEQKLVIYADGAWVAIDAIADDTASVYPPPLIEAIGVLRNRLQATVL